MSEEVVAGRTVAAAAEVPQLHGAAGQGGGEIAQVDLNGFRGIRWAFFYISGI